MDFIAPKTKRLREGALVVGAFICGLLVPDFGSPTDFQECRQKAIADYHSCAALPLGRMCDVTVRMDIEACAYIYHVGEPEEKPHD